jgi:hypothetical protein
MRIFMHRHYISWPLCLADPTPTGVYCSVVQGLCSIVQVNLRLCEVALLGHHPRPARHVSTVPKVFHLGVHVS